MALIAVIGAYSWSLWGSPAFGSLADQPYHRAFAEEFDQAWCDGDFPPRWAAGANGGRGSVGFVVYPPFFAFVTACWLRLGVSVTEALRLAVLTAVAGVFGAVYDLARGWLSHRRSVLAAALVLLLPGVTFVALGRGMYPNFAALGWVALLAAASQRALLGQRARRNAIVAVVAAAGLVLTHTLTAYLLAILVLVISPLLWRVLGLRGMIRAAGLAFVAAGLTAWYSAPLIQAGSYTRLDYLGDSHRYRDSVFGGGSAGGGAVFEQDWVFLNDLGRYVVVAQSLLALVVALVLTDNRVDGSRGDPGDGRRILFLRSLPWTAGFAFLAATAPGAALLLQLPRAGMIQFSWRWQLLVSLWCGVGVAALPWEKRSALPAAVAAATVLVFSPLLSRSEALPRENSGDLPAVLSRAEFEALPALDRAAYAGNLIELRPNGVDTRYYLPAEFGRVEVMRGTARVNSAVLRTSYREYLVEAVGKAAVRLVTYYAPGWSARLNEDAIPITMEKATGLQLVEVPDGVHRLVVEYRAPRPW